MAFSLKKLGETRSIRDEMLMGTIGVNHSMEGNGFDLGDGIQTSSVVSLTLAQIVAEAKAAQWASTYCAHSRIQCRGASLNHWAISLYRLATLGDPEINERQSGGR